MAKLSATRLLSFLLRLAATPCAARHSLSTSAKILFFLVNHNTLSLCLGFGGSVYASAKKIRAFVLIQSIKCTSVDNVLVPPWPIARSQLLAALQVGTLFGSHRVLLDSANLCQLLLPRARMQ